MNEHPRCLIIGIGEYPRGIRRLPAVAADVEEMRRLLTSDDGAFPPESANVITDEGATRLVLLDALREVFRSATSEEIVFVYIAGHGFFSGGESFYYIPYDCKEQDIAGTAIPLTEIRALFDKCASENVLLWLDFCHSGGIRTRNAFTDEEATRVIRRTLQIVTGQGKVIMCACTPEQSAYEDAEHGLFTKYLVKGLKGSAVNKAGEVTVSSLHDYIDKEMGSERQRPMLFGEMTGRIVLMRRQGELDDTPVSKSGSWILLGDRFFKSSGVQNTGVGKLVIRIPHLDPQDGAWIRSLVMDHPLRRPLLSYAFRNAAHLVKAENVESEAHGDGLSSIITLRPEIAAFGGAFAADIALKTPERTFSADEIAELRARRILLGTRPARHLVSMDEKSLDTMIRGVNTQYTLGDCVFLRLHPSFKDDPLKFVQTARLAAIFELIASFVFEEVIELSVGPLKSALLHVKCVGRRPAVGRNVPGKTLAIEGHVLLE